MKYLSAVFLLLLFAFSLNAQTSIYYQELNGIKLKQFREVPRNEFGAPTKTGKLDNGFEYELFRLKPDDSLYMVFEYSAELNDQISSVQMTGTDQTADLGFGGLRFGDDATWIEYKLGKPSSIVDVGEYGKRWEYKDSNFSVEINPKGKFSSVKIKDISADVFKTPDAGKIPRWKDVLDVLTSNQNGLIARILAPDMELYRGNDTLFFTRSLKAEIFGDQSKLFAVIKELAQDLKSVNPANPDEYEENFRMSLGQDPKHVIKIKKGHKIKEIVFKYEWGEFLIWEIKAEK